MVAVSIPLRLLMAKKCSLPVSFVTLEGDRMKRRDEVRQLLHKVFFFASWQALAQKPKGQLDRACIASILRRRPSRANLPLYSTLHPNINTNKAHVHSLCTHFHDDVLHPPQYHPMFVPFLCPASHLVGKSYPRPTVAWIPD